VRHKAACDCAACLPLFSGDSGIQVETFRQSLDSSNHLCPARFTTAECGDLPDISGFLDNVPSE
jgi:hypothetical protein